MKRLILALLLLIALPAQATTIQEVTSRSGVTAWLVEDHKLPVIAMRFAFRGGVEQDPVDQQGLANLTMEMMTEGAGSLDATAFQQALADRSISLGFEAGRDALYGQVKALSADRTTAFALLQLALTQPRFDQKDIDRLKAAQMAALRQQLGSPDWQARYALFQYIFANHPYSERRLGSVPTLTGLTHDDVVGFAQHHLARDNLLVAVAGDITPKDLAAVLDKVFGSLPRHARLNPVGELSWPAAPASILINRSGTQTEMLFAMPAPKRDNPDWYAATIVNYIMGGGGFASRLMKDVREDRGLTYGIDTGLSSMEHGSALIGEAATDNGRTKQAWDVTLATMQNLYNNGVTADESKAAKDYLTGALPLTMTSTDKIAAQLVDIQVDRLGIDYLDRRNELLRSVTDADIARVIHDWFNPAGLSLTLVGSPTGFAPTETREQIRE